MPTKKSGPGEGSRSSKKYSSFRKADNSGRGSDNNRVGRGASSDYSGVGPRVGTGQKKGTVKVSKPSSVSSGWVPAKTSKSKRKL